MRDHSVLRTFRTLVATPCFGGSICLNYVLSIINFQRECAAAGMGIDFYFNPGDSPDSDIGRTILLLRTTLFREPRRITKRSARCRCPHRSSPSTARRYVS
jgi:hypothetical protein